MRKQIPFRLLHLVVPVLSFLVLSAGDAADELSRTERIRRAMQSLSNGETALAEDRFEAAEAFFTETLTLLVTDTRAPLPKARAWNGRARVLDHTGEWGQAALAYEEAADLFTQAFPAGSESEALARYQRAHALWQSGRGTEAEVDLLLAIEIWQRRGTAPEKGPAAAERLHAIVQSGSSANAR